MSNPSNAPNAPHEPQAYITRLKAQNFRSLADLSVTFRRLLHAVEELVQAVQQGQRVVTPQRDPETFG
jgi:hypothetical protein